MRTPIWILFCLALPAACLAQDPAAPLTVEAAVSEAIRRNPRLTAAARDIVAARAGVRGARALTNPTLLFSPAITPGGVDEELLIQQPLELNGTRSARRGVAEAQLRQTQALAVVALRDLVFETKRAYFELARAQELRRLAEDALRVTEELDRGTRRQAEEGLRPGIDRVQTEIEVTRARQRLSQARTEETRALAGLNNLLGRDGLESLGDLPPLPLPNPLSETETLPAQALSHRTEAAANVAVRDGFREQARLFRAEGRPDLAPQFRAGGLTRGVQDTGIGIGLTLPIFDHGSRRNRVRQAEEAARAQEARTEGVRRDIRREVEQALVRVRGAEALIRDYQGGVLEQARRLLEARRTGFQAGLTSLLELLEAQRTHRGIIAEYTNALADYAEARAELERATGAVPADLLPTATSGERRPR